MKALVSYYSESGNTEKVAQAIYDAIGQAQKDIVSVKEVKDKALESYDVVFCGFPVHAHSVPGAMESFIKTIPKGKKVAFFGTHGSFRGGELAVTAFYDALSLAKELTVLGTFGCRGQVKQKIIDGLMQKAEHKAWAEEAQSAKGHPDTADLEDAQDWAKFMITRARAHF